MSHVYDNPRYYEIAFSFRDFTHEVDVFEECIRRYAGVRVESFLERGCGNAPHMPELVKRGYRYIGLDINDAMLAYARSKASDTGNATFLKADMCNFRVEQTAQFAFVSLGSLFAPSTTDLVQHFRSVGDAIQSGGLYLLDWCVQFSPLVNRKETWSIEKDHICVKTTVSGRTINPVDQLCEESIEMEVTDSGKSSRYSTSCKFREVYPQEFLLLVEHCTSFAFIGWWNNWNLDEPLKADSRINRPIVLLRRN